MTILGTISKTVKYVFYILILVALVVLNAIALYTTVEESENRNVDKIFIRLSQVATGITMLFGLLMMIYNLRYAKYKAKYLKMGILYMVMFIFSTISLSVISVQSGQEPKDINKGLTYTTIASITIIMLICLYYLFNYGFKLIVKNPQVAPVVQQTGWW